ncbi:PepSY-associated TM helix domain-containing protein [Ornithobacterium rhinotracheale]|uniref:Putative iron-regulated membrane protein n=1 Tax=Ornithobacterium rhinotracheale (strain ATCC 51463 / DSM 15997 / CCUG 23171 / CIP 104009 / LMG 9086) TaxID=867902 RepID=I4A2I9_ORNRL|nr:PepSY-associated TM helix domain-containing protein [Ornithobacterium rhinotracheale]AFL98173.1 putative iron-regulated membrane protein [Ornithobacterium rhinotracheale DSM 15997]AIP99921.1 peptidase [Ornithobacterium rhinotracheale ORT-UMN 88]KGB66089.1 peptidase [Ornithobacterium rhinotracheale H06-030791]MCK0193527.1 PepSY domain-containing protein [Ornithobacterium rhinotracheale]MCK0201525.1 PepSY domain-containing protein [Ornithobacterium rhinotracheale]
MKRKKTKKTRFKNIISKLHLWFGLAIGVLIFIISITGALYVFKDEIQNSLRKEVLYHGEPGIENKKTLPLSILEQKVNTQTKIPYPVHWATIPLDKSRSYEFHYFEKNLDAWNYFDEFIVYKTAYVNPFTGKVLKVYDEKMGFFNIVKFIHWSFLLKSSWGTYLVGIPVLIFIFMLISGIILWWPKNKKARRQRVWFQWKNIKSWRRKNYDLHSILGFYSAFAALIIAITGVFYSFFLVKILVYFLFSGGKTEYPFFTEYKTTAPIEMKTEYTLDKIAEQVEALFPKAYAYNLDFGHEHKDDHQHPNLSVYVKDLSYSYHRNNTLIFDENSGELLKIHRHMDKNFGEKVVAANYDIHVGAILGIWTKILAFIISLICASLPITGFLVWWGRKNKKIKNIPS